MLKRYFFKSLLSIVVLMAISITHLSAPIHAEEPTIITNADDLQNMKNNGNYKLGSDIDLSNRNWVPISIFSGTFDGDGHVISGLTIQVEQDQRFNGLFGQTNNATIKNVGLENVNIDAGNYSAALAGYMQGGIIENSYATGKVNGRVEAGGLVGQLRLDGIISNSYADVEVIGTDKYGGLVARIDNGTVIHSYSTGKVSGTGNREGGLIGEITNNFEVTSSYWDKQTSEVEVSAGGEGLSTAEMKSASNYTGWDFTDIWEIQEGVSYPSLQLFDNASSGDPGGPIIEAPSLEWFDVSLSYKVGESDPAIGLEAGKMLQAFATITSQRETEEDVLLIVALYNAGGAMVNLSSASVTVAPNETVTPQAGFLLPNQLDGYTVRSFMWSGSELGSASIVPLSLVLSLP